MDGMGRPPPMLLFAGDFDDPVVVSVAEPVEVEPATIEPVFRLADLEAARAEAAEAARAALQLELEEAHQLQVRLALAEIGHAMNDARRAAERIAEEQAEAITGLLVSMVHTALPTLCTRHAVAQTRDLLLTLRRALLSEPQVTIQLHPATADGLAADLTALREAMPGDLRLTRSAAMAPGDARITWQNGAAVRDTQQFLAGLESALCAAGLLPAADLAMEQRELEHAG